MTFDRPHHATRHCRHYSYEIALRDGGPRCAAGVDLSAPGACGRCMPTPRGECPHREEFSQGERDAWERWLKERAVRLFTAIGALPRPIPLNTKGEVACPNCNGKLFFARWHRGAAIQCQTPNCCEGRFNIAAGAQWPLTAQEDAAA